MFATVSRRRKAISRKAISRKAISRNVLVTKVINSFRADVQSNIIKFLSIQEQACIFYDESLCMYVQLLNKKYKPLLIKAFVDSVVCNSSLSKAQKLGQLAVWCVDSFDFDLNVACFNKKQEKEFGHNSCKCSCIPDGNLWHSTFILYMQEHHSTRWESAFELQRGCDVIELLRDIDTTIANHFIDSGLFINIIGRRDYEWADDWNWFFYLFIDGNYWQRRQYDEDNEDTNIPRIRFLCQHLALKNQLDSFEVRLLHGLLVTAAWKNFKSLVPLLLGAGAGKYESSSSNSAILTAAKYDHHEVLGQLLNAGVDPNGIWMVYNDNHDIEILTPLQAAKRRGHQMCIKILRDNGAKELESEELSCVGIAGLIWGLGFEKYDIVPSTETTHSIKEMKKTYRINEMKKENAQYKKDLLSALNVQKENAFMYHRLRKRARARKGNPKSKRKKKVKRKFTSKSGGRRLGEHFQFYQTEIRLMNEELHGDEELRFLN